MCTDLPIAIPTPPHPTPPTPPDFKLYFIIRCAPGPSKQAHALIKATIEGLIQQFIALLLKAQFYVAAVKKVAYLYCRLDI